MAEAILWTPEEDAVLDRLHAAGLDWETCAVALGRTDRACETRWRNRHRVRTGPNPWTPEEDASLRSSLARGMSWTEAAGRLPGRSVRACMARGRILGVSAQKPVLKRPGALSGRRCHDCGKPTSDYRCPACLARWRAKHGVPVNADGGEDAYPTFGGRAQMTDF